jgi:hypothetical protein
MGVLKYINFYSILTLLLVVYILFNYCKKKIHTYKGNKDTSFNLDISEYDTFTNYNIIEPNNYTYLFWNGGFSSTFRLCQLLLLEEKPVQTIYINTNNLALNPLKNKIELKIMKNIRKILIKDYPTIKINFPPTRYISRIKKDTIITNKFNSLHKDLGMFEFTSEIDKYETIARFSYNNDNDIELPIDNDETHLNDAISNYLENYNILNHKKISKDIPLKFNNINIFNKCLFPISHFSKHKLKEISTYNNLNYILNMTWSCDFPIELDNNNVINCKKCTGCLKRVFPVLIPK